MTFVKKQLTPFSSAAADPLFNFTQPFIQQGVISGRYYSADEVAYGNPKPGYLEPSANSNVVTVVASSAIPLRLVFALGLHDANTGGEIGSWRTFTGKTSSNVNVTVSSSEKGWIYAEINENGQPNNPGAWTITYANEPAKDRTYSSQETEPVAPVDGNVWFNPITNLLKKYNSDTSQWETKKRVYLGEAGIGNNGYVYTVQSWYPELGYAQYQDSFYPPYYENPWRHYDGVSFLTDGQYTAMEAANWANTFTVAQAVAGNQIAMNAVANSAFAMANITQAANSMNAVANSLLAIQTIEANTSAIGFTANSSVAMTRIANSVISMSFIANSSVYMSSYVNNAIAVSSIANSQIAQQSILTGSQNTVFLTTIANNASSLSALSKGSVGNILFTLIGTNSSYQTLVANAQGQLVALANSASGPILALGGNTVTQVADGGVNYRVHRFTGTGTLNVRSVGEQPNVQYLVVAGGGSGGFSFNSATQGGGGAGGYLTGPSHPVTESTSYTITVGAGGAATIQGASSGSNSVFSSFTAIRGGMGGSGAFSVGPEPGGSGGGGSQNNTGGTGTPGQGFNGGNGNSTTGGGGGGGASQVGGNGSGNPATLLGGDGGSGVASPITGTPVFYAGGGGGSYLGTGGSGIGGNAGTAPTNTGSDGTTNTGSGGGAARGTGPGSGPTAGGSGGSGIVVVRYPIQKV